MSIRILYPTPFYVGESGTNILGGGELTMHAFFKEFVKEGWDVTVFVVSRTPSKTYTIDGVKVIEQYYPTHLQEFEKLVQEYKPNIGFISSIDVRQSFAFFNVMKKYGTRIITYEQFYRNIYSVFHNMLNIPIDAKLIPPEGRDMLTKADAVMVNSEYTGLVLKRYIGRNGIVVYPPIQIENVIASEHSREYVTLINPSVHKGKETFLGLARDFPATKFMVVEMPHDRATGPEFSLPNITILPFQTDVREIYKKTKILLFPTLTDESFGRSMVEAMANAIPVIGRDVGGIPYVLGKAGIVIGANEPHDTWFRELRRLLEDKEHYNNYSKLAFERHKNYHYETEINKVKSIVNNLIQNIAVIATPVLEDDDLLITKLEKMDVHDDFINDDGTQVKRTHGEIYFGEPNAYDVMSLTVNFPSVREILVSVTSEIGKKFRAAFIDFAQDRPIHEYVDAVAKEIIKISPKLLILGAWIPQYAPIIEAVKKSSKTKIALSWHSNFSQMELSPDRELDIFIGVCSLLKAEKIDYLFMSDEEDASLLRHTINPNIFWLADFINLDFVNKVTKVQLPSDTFNISLFAFPTARKNLLAQIAAIRAVRGSTLHVNNFIQAKQRQSINYGNFVTSMNVPCVNHGWMDKATYYNVMSSVDAGLQVTFAETFSIVTAEHMALGIPCLTSSMVPIMKNAGELIEHLVVKNANSAKEIAQKLSILRDDKDLSKRLGILCKEHIHKINNQHQMTSINMLGTLLARL